VLTVYFVKRIRDIVAFSSVDELINQLTLDLEHIK
jgi:FAD synthase